MTPTLFLVSSLWDTDQVGAFEFPPFKKGTLSIANAVADLVESDDLVAVAGGGDTISSLDMAGVKQKLTFVSTAGGAFLEWMEGKSLPGVEVLLYKK